ncbi:MAG: hypothetical protein PHH06_03445, partial [Candidatus Gracilibacteria bacterium]|nr:hypothetical protein [Candidatus Gracilibacteria bacterium]
MKYILIGWFFFIFLAFLFLLILPTFGVRIFEKQIVLFVLPFLFALWYSINRYYFLDIKIGLGKITVFIISIFFTFILVNLLKFYFLSFGEHFLSFWGVSSQFGIFDL